MELSSGQQRLLFVVVVLLLAALGIYLVGPGTHHRAAATPTPSASSTGPAPATSTAPAVQPATTPAAPATSAGGADIYQWLPFTQQDLTQAAQVTVAFAADYDTYSYTETDTAYIDKMASLVTSELAATLKNAYDTLGIAQARSAQKQVSTGSGGIASIRSFGAGSLMFVANITQKLATTQGTTTATKQYWVTVVKNAAGWQVNDIEPAGAGNP
jgi:hypothetical protein